MKMYPSGYLNQLADCCKENEILLIVDEIAMGFGRTGKRFAHNHAGIDPDLVCIGKALTGGYMPLSACIVKDVLYDTFSNLGAKDCTFYHGNTYAGHPIGCAAALAALRIYEAENTVANTAEKATAMREQMKPLEQRSCVKETRFLGMIGVVELHAQYADEIPHIKQTLRQAGYLFRPRYCYLPYATPDYFHRRSHPSHQCPCRCSTPWVVPFLKYQQTNRQSF